MKGLNRIPTIGFAFTLLTLGMLSGCGKQSSDEYIKEAQQYVSENNPAAAIVALKNAVQIEPKSASARFELGQLYLQQRQFESAEKELNRALEYGFDPTKVLPLITQAYQKTGAYSAISKLEHQYDGLTSVEKAEIGYFKVVALVRLNKIEDARLLIEDLRGIDTSSVFKGLTAAYTQVLDKEYEKAAELVLALRDQAPQNAEVLKLLAQLKLSLNQPKEAAEIYKDYVQLYPEDRQTTFIVAKLLVDIGELTEAEPYIDKLLLVNDLNPLLNQLKAATFAYKGEYSDALRRAEIAITGGVDAASLRLIAGYAAYQTQDFSSANRHLSYIAGLLPNNHPGLKLLAASQLQLGLTSEVGDVLERLDQLSEEDAPLFSRASYDLLKDGFEKEAKLLVEKSTEISRTAEDLTRLGLLQLSLNNVDGIVNLEEAVAKSPSLESAQATLAKAYIVTKQYDKALDLAENWKKAAPQDIKPYLLAGDTYLRLKQFSDAKLELDKALLLESNNPAPKLALVKLALAQSDLPKAKLLLNQILVEFPADLTALGSYYILSKQTGEKVKGIDKVQRAFDTNSSNTELRLLLAKIKLVEKEYQTAIDLLTELNGQIDLPKSYWVTLGQSYIRTNKRREATTHYDNWLLQQPNDKDAVMGMLMILDNQNKFVEGYELVQAFLENRNDLQMELLKVHFLLMQREYSDAQKAYDKLPESVLDRPVVRGFLARLQLNNKQTELALENAKIAYSASPNNRNLALLLFTYESLKQSEQVKALLQKHVEKYPQDIAARMLLAERLISSDIAAAILTYEAALQQNPDNYIASNNLAYLYLQEGDIDKAKGYGVKAVELEPNNASALDTLAQIYAAEKNFEEALDLYSRAITDAMQNEEIFLNYVETLLLSDDKFLAERKLKQREMKQRISIIREAKLRADFGLE